MSQAQASQQGRKGEPSWYCSCISWLADANVTFGAFNTENTTDRMLQLLIDNQFAPTCIRIVSIIET